MLLELAAQPNYAKSLVRPSAVQSRVREYYLAESLGINEARGTPAQTTNLQMKHRS